HEAGRGRVIGGRAMNPQGTIPPREEDGPAEAHADDRDTLEMLAEEFVDRRRHGEPASIEEFVVRCPERAEEIRALFPTILAMEQHKPGREATSCRLPGISGLGPSVRLG